MKDDWDQLAEEAWRVTIACIVALAVIFALATAATLALLP